MYKLGIADQLKKASNIKRMLAARVSATHMSKNNLIMSNETAMRTNRKAI